ncbi:MAG TPA: type 1 glutamine amidotransferase [Deltaproteobacteria bacterium]|nr:type 1 glutamine amidotransferase [Deltaproteobacteria bacterium]
MQACFFQHVPFEGLAFIAEWAQNRDVSLRRVALYKNEPLPSLDSCDALIVMGGPMGAADEEAHSWLKQEKQFIEKAIEANKVVMGICLGAQIIASVLGARVFKNADKEIGWFPVDKISHAGPFALVRRLPEQFMAFHWHGDTFDIPAGAVHLAESAACRNQGFIYGNRIVALQFHLESNRSGIEALIENCGSELISAPFIQTAEEIRQGYPHIESSNSLMAGLMDEIIEEHT